MTDREFENWWKEQGNLYNNFEKLLAGKAWQARGELDAMRIKELKDRLNSIAIDWQVKERECITLRNDKATLEIQVQTLREALEIAIEFQRDTVKIFHEEMAGFHKDQHKHMDELLKVTEQALNSTPSQDEWIRKDELDAVRIKELEAKNKVAEESELLALRNNDGLRVQIAELTAKLVKAKEALKWIDSVSAMNYEYVKVARQALEELDK